LLRHIARRRLSLHDAEWAGNPVPITALSDHYVVKLRREAMYRVQLLSAAAIVAIMSLSACANTVRGVGADVRGTANAVEDQVKR